MECQESVRLKMNKYGILNRDINDVLGRLGHTDKICICDCGLPMPKDIQVVDLTLKIGVPSFIDVLDIIKEHMVIEKVILASEIKSMNKDLDKKVNNYFENIEYVSHESFKEITKDIKLIIRTGEALPYANIILQSGVIF